MEIGKPRKLYPYTTPVHCVKCGSPWTTAPTWHMHHSETFWSGSFPFLHFCMGYAVDHLHYDCRSCGAAWAMACVDIRESEGVDNG